MQCKNNYILKINSNKNKLKYRNYGGIYIMKNNYEEAYSEVWEVLKYIPKEDYDKIPKKTIKLIHDYRSENTKFEYNVALPFDKQNISKDAKVILGILYRNCWATQEEKIQITKREKQRLVEKENEKREKYHPDNLFKNKEEKISNELQENHYLVVPDKWYKRIITKIKSFFKINR